MRVIVTYFVCGCVGCARRYGSTLIADDREDVLADLAALGCPALPDFSVTCSDSYKTTNTGACASFCDTNVIPCLDGDTCHTGGNVVLVFFAVIIGAMGIGQANPSATSLAKARVAGYEMFSVIHREVAISTASCACRCRVVSCRVVSCRALWWLSIDERSHLACVHTSQGPPCVEGPHARRHPFQQCPLLVPIPS